MVETSGTGLQLVTNLAAEGTFTGSGLDFGGLAGRAVSGNYALSWGLIAPRLRLTGLNLRSDDDTYTGQGRHSGRRPVSRGADRRREGVTGQRPVG